MIKWLIAIAIAMISTSAFAAYPAPYTCTRNFYVATTGVDNSTCGPSGTPCATIQGANDNIALTAGDCVNVGAGTYTGQTAFTKGGNANQANGYVTYIGAPSSASIFTISGSGYGISLNTDYIIIDGLKINGTTSDYCVGASGHHHLMVLNSTISGCNGGGIGFANGGDYFTIAGNTISNTSHTSPYSESGISIYEPEIIQGFTATLPWDVQYYHIQVLQNISHDNMISSSVTTNHWDGDGIQMDDFQHVQNAGVAYPFGSIVAGNYVYANGGRGIQLTNPIGIDVYNNTAYDNNLDTMESYGGEIEVQSGTLTGVYNNIMRSIPNGTHNHTLVVTQAPASKLIITNNLMYNGTNGVGDVMVNLTGNDSVILMAITAANKMGVNPQLSSLPTDAHPVVGSPTLGAGVNFSAAMFLLTTQDGFPQPFPTNIGAYNVTPTPPPPTGPAPTVTLTTNAATITAGQSATLSWTSTGATTCYSPSFPVSACIASGISGSVSVSPTTTTQYSIICSNDYGQTTANVIVAVSNCPP